MKTRRKTNNISRFVSCIFMMLALAWLTVSFPIVYSALEAYEMNRSEHPGSSSNSNDIKIDNPFANTTEEKPTTSNNNSISEEYLHDTHSSEHHITILTIDFHVEHSPTYIAFYGELESPPPDFS